MRVVIDTNVLVRATPASQGGPAREVLERLLSGSHILITSAPLIAEVVDVLRRSSLRRLHGMSDNRITEFIATLESSSDVFALPTTMPALVPDDPQDAPVVATAIVGRCRPTPLPPSFPVPCRCAMRRCRSIRLDCL